MRWNRLLFAHWPVDFDALRPLVPEGLELETFDGTAWVGVVPFDMTRVRPRFVPPIPWLSRSAELNVRTYVTAGGKPGVWFFSLDAERALAVWGARLTYHLPYFKAAMRVHVREGGWIEYASRRTHRGAASARFKGRYRPTGEVDHSRPGSLDYFLTERMCLYARRADGRLLRADIDHQPWPLQPAEGMFEENTMAEASGIRLPGVPPLLHYAERIDAVAWWPVPVD